jgi:hypothetical protein
MGWKSNRVYASDNYMAFNAYTSTILEMRAHIWGLENQSLNTVEVPIQEK